jgi:hypothetical protein
VSCIAGNKIKGEIPDLYVIESGLTANDFILEGIQKKRTIKLNTNQSMLIK